MPPTTEVFLSARDPQGRYQSLSDQRTRRASGRDPYCDLGYSVREHTIKISPFQPLRSPLSSLLDVLKTATLCSIFFQMIMVGTDRHDAHSDRHDLHTDRHDAHSDRHVLHTDRHDAHSDRHDLHTDRHDAGPLLPGPLLPGPPLPILFGTW